MTPNQTSEDKLKEGAASLMKDMEATAKRVRELIVGMPPHELLGYIYAQHMMKSMSERDVKKQDSEYQEPDDVINQNQFLLEYIHAVLATDPAPDKVEFKEEKRAELFELSSKLREQAMFYAMASSADKKDGAFGPNTADIEFHAKSSWVLLRGNRYQVLEGEFYRYVLEPHDEALKEIYGIGADEVARGFQAMADTVRTGQAIAIGEMMNQFQTAKAFAAAKAKPLDDVMEEWAEENKGNSTAVRQAIEDMFFGGIANVSRHTDLPNELLADLAYERGEDNEFFAGGDYSGTPYRTLPVRKKPLIKLGSDYFAVDPCFTRDAGYRALLFNLLQRKPAYKAEFNERQKVMSEAAFADILSAQLPGATILQEVYYKDPITKQWSENDTLILMEDVLYLVEAKAGAAATIASPALDFGRHAQSVQDLVIKAYKQCERFFNYLNTADEVPLFHMIDGKYVECARLRRADYRVMLPIGLTVESFSPLSAFCKELPEIIPLLGKHAFISLSIDDLFVLKRFLPTPGELAHYMEVRQAVAGLRSAHLFDELDHLGAYLKKNRVDIEMSEQLKQDADFVMWDGMSFDIDRSFESENWDTNRRPVQEFPDEMRKLLGAINATRQSGWLRVDSYFRNLSSEGRSEFAAMLAELRKSLNQHEGRYFIYGQEEETPFFIWLHRTGGIINWNKVNANASSAALVTSAETVTGLMIETTADGTYKAVSTFQVSRPAKRTEANAHIFDDAERMKQRAKKFVQEQKLAPQRVKHLVSIPKKVGRNELCPCESGLKYKKCHGR
ncbi:SEC-C metal-binding domain-containing protein [Agrobacterium burrii]